MGKSTQTARRRKANGKPSKPYPDFPLFPHASGRWAKKINGKLEYFGRWGNKSAGKIIPVDDVKGSAMEAVKRYEWQREALYDGRTPTPIDQSGYTIRDLCNAFLTSKKHKVDSGELSPHTFTDYRRACEQLIGQFGRTRRVDDLQPADFEAFRAKLAKGASVVTLKNSVNRCRIVLKFAYDQGEIDRPVKFGQSFDQPASKVIRKARNEAGENIFTRAEILEILDACDPFMLAMVLLGINGGLGNSDVANLPQSAIVKHGQTTCLEYPRPKTEIKRLIPLWPETVSALNEAIAKRPKPKDPADAGMCFITINGNRWMRTKPGKTDPNKFVTVNTVAGHFSKILKRLNINGRKRLGFYTLRHCFETIAGESKDQVAVDAIMGHADPSMAAVYRAWISEGRLQAVTDHVREWLFGDDRTEIE